MIPLDKMMGKTIKEREIVLIKNINHDQKKTISLAHLNDIIKINNPHLENREFKIEIIFENLAILEIIS